MADTVASLMVEINGDASGLESAIRGAAASIAGLEGASGKLGAGIEKGTKQSARAVNSHAQNVAKVTKQTENAADSIANAEQKISDSVQKSTENSKKAVISRSQAIIQTGQKWKDMGTAVNDVTKPIQNASLVLAAGGVAAAKFAVDFEDNFAAVEKTVEGTPEQLANIKQGIIDLTTVGRNGNMAIPLSTKELTEIASAGGQLGIATDNILEYTEVMAQLGTATNLTGANGAAALARLMNVTNTSQSDVRNLGSAVVDLGNNFATSEAEIVDMALSMGATGTEVGISTQDVLAYSTALSSMGIEAEAGGSALQRIWMDIQNSVSSGSDILADFGKVSGKSAEEFAKDWKNDASGAFQDFLKGLSESEDKVGALKLLGFDNVRDQKALLALAGDKGFALLTEAIQRSNKAWSENTALQDEFNTKGSTTASQIQVTKNNFVEAARSIGETMLPTIKDLSVGAAEFGQKLAGLSESKKKTIVGIGTAIVGAGAAAKVTASSMDTIGTVIKGFGKLAPVIKTGITSPLGIAAAAAATIGVVAAGSYNAWYNSNYKWSEGLEEGNEKVEKSLNKYKQVTALKKQVEELQAVITNPNSSTEQIDAAKAKLEEIKALLSEEYNLVINSDNSNLDSALDSLKGLSKNELQQNINEQMGELISLRDKMDSYDGDYAAETAKYEAALEKQTKASDYLLKISDINAELKAGNITLDQRNEKVRDLAREYGLADEVANGYHETLGAIKDDYKDATKDVEKYKERLGDLKETHDRYIELSGDMADMNTELLNMAALEGNNSDVERYMENIADLVKLAGLDMDEYAKSTALARNGVESLDDAWAKAGQGNGQALAGIVTDYIDAMGRFGASAEDTAIGASLLKNGFNDLNEAAAAGKLDLITQQANEIAHSLGLIPDNKSIVINADGNIEIIDKAAKAIEKVNQNGAVQLSVNADGDISVIDTADEKLKALAQNGDVNIKFNVDTNGFDINDLNGNNLGEITAEGKIIWVNDVPETPSPTAEGTVNYGTGEVEKPEDTTAEGEINYEADVEKPEDTTVNGTANYTMGEHPTEAPPINGTANYAGDFSGVGSPPTLYGTVIYSAQYAKNATGTDYFGGGLAMVNDQKGIADPRELIVDNGRAFIPQGTDVILPLSKGAKVYTAAQTKTIMKGLGIAQYASGKDNTESIIPIDDWLYKTNVIPTGDSSSLKEWIRRQADSHQEIIKETFSEFIKASENWLKHEEKYNGLMYEDKVDAIKRIESKVQKAYDKGLIKEREYLDTMQKWDEEYLDTFSDMIDEKRQKSADYISLHSYKNDWAAVGDDPFSAYMRVEDRERWRAETFNDWDTYAEHMSEFSDDMLDDMISAEKEALDFQKEYFGMSAKEYSDGIDAIKVKAEEYYKFLDVSSRKQAETDRELFEWTLDSKREQYDDYMKSADNYFKIRETFGDWEDVGDSKSRFYMAELVNIEKMYRDGTIGWEQYNDESLDKYLSFYKSVEEEFDDKLQDLTDEKSELREVYSEKRSALQAEWDQEDRTENLAEVNRLIDIYKNAVTDTGLKKYHDLLDQKKQLERDQQLADLETEQNDKIEEIEKRYERLEEDKKSVLKSMQRDNYRIFETVEQLPEDTAKLKEINELTNITAENVKNSAAYEAAQISNLSDILKAINKVADKVGASRTQQNVTYNNGQYRIYSAAGAQTLIKQLTGTIASGLGSVIIG